MKEPHYERKPTTMIQPQSLIFALILWRSYVHVRQPQFLGSFILWDSLWDRLKQIIYEAATTSRILNLWVLIIIIAEEAYNYTIVL